MTPSAPSVLVLHETLAADARIDERDALVQAREVSQALRSLGWATTVMDTGLDLARTSAAIRAERPTCVFNLVEALDGNGSLIHLLPSLLDAAGIPYTGCPADALFLSSQKLLAKRWMRLHGVATPDWFEAAPESDGDDGPWIVKSVWEHASFGLDDDAVVASAAAAIARIARCERRHGGPWFAERYVDGREFNVSLLEENGEPRVLPIAEMTFVDYPESKPRIVGYAAKWDDTAPEYHATRRVFPPLADAERDGIVRAARRCWRIFGLRGYARVDIRLDATGRAWVLEVNANPCLSGDAGFVAAAAEAKLRFEAVIERVVRASVGPDAARFRAAG